MNPGAHGRTLSLPPSEQPGPEPPPKLHLVPVFQTQLFRHPSQKLVKYKPNRFQRS
jgi:hypothetical protein